MMRKLQLATTFSALILSLSLVMSPVVKADITNPVTGVFGQNTDNAAESGDLFAQFFIMIWQALISVGALTVLIYFLWAGYEWIYAGGEASKVQKARDKMTQAMIGLIILVSTFVIISFLSQLFFGDEFNILQLNLPGPNQETTTGGSGSGFVPAENEIDPSLFGGAGEDKSGKAGGPGLGGSDPAGRPDDLK